MAKTKEELEQLKNEFNSMQEKLSDLTDDELNEATGGLLKSPDKSGYGTYLLSPDQSGEDKGPFLKSTDQSGEDKGPIFRATDQSGE